MISGLHPQWASLDFDALLSLPAALLIVDATNSVLSKDGAQQADRLWERSRRPGGTLENTARLVEAARAGGVRVGWFRYEYLRDHYPATPMDDAQYRYWRGGRNWTDEQKGWDSALVPELAAIQRAGDFEILYKSFGNIFLGTPLQQMLNAWGVRTLLLAGYHLDECVEQAARTARDLGFMPLVAADCCCCAHEGDETSTLKRIDSHWAPVISTDQIATIVQRRLQDTRAAGPDTKVPIATG